MKFITYDAMDLQCIKLEKSTIFFFEMCLWSKQKDSNHCKSAFLAWVDFHSVIRALQRYFMYVKGVFRLLNKVHWCWKSNIISRYVYILRVWFSNYSNKYLNSYKVYFLDIYNI